MKSYLKYFRENPSFVLLSLFWLFVLLNPVFKKYDYGAEFPLVIAFGVLLLLFGIFEWKKKREQAWLEQLFLVIFTFFVSLSFLFSQTQNIGFSEILAFLGVSSFYLIFAYRKNSWISGFLNVVKIGVFMAVIIGFSFYFLRDEVRMFGPFFNILYHSNVWPNAFALFLIMAWPIFLFGKKSKKKILSKFFTIIAISLIFSGLLLTYSRGAMITFAGQFILLLIYFIKKIEFKTIFITILIALLTGTIFFGANYLRSLNHKVIDVEERASFENSESLTSKQERIDFWLGAIELAKEKPFLGWGPFSFRYAYNGIQKTFLGNADHPHNIFLKFAVEEGFVAAFAFILFLISVLAAVIGRFGKLSREKKNLTFILIVSVAGAFAHNLIDYNFNFLANLLLLFIFLAFIRSLIVKKVQKNKPIAINIVLPLTIALISFYEGSLLVLSYISQDSYLEYSNYPRNYYLNTADFLIQKKDYDAALWYLDKQIYKNPLDSQARYLKGVIYCERKNSEKCVENMSEALKLNPMNNFNYYIGVVRALDKEKASEKIQKKLDKIPELIKQYFDYVQNNVHFTAYTSNVEAAAELIDLYIPKNPDMDISWYFNEKKNMLMTAQKLRLDKTF